MPLASHAHAVNKAQVDRALDHGMRQLSLRLNRLITWIEEPPVPRPHQKQVPRGQTEREPSSHCGWGHPALGVDARGEDDSASALKGRRAHAEPTRPQPRNSDGSAAQERRCVAQHEVECEPQMVLATLDVYDVEGHCTEVASKKPDTSMSSLLSQSQQLAEKMFGLKTRYTLRQDGEGQADAVRDQDAGRDGKAKAGRTGGTVSSDEVKKHRLLLQVGRPDLSTEQDTPVTVASSCDEKSTPAVPTLRLDPVVLNLSGAHYFIHNQSRPHSARFAVRHAPKSTSSRPNSARLAPMSARERPEDNASTLHDPKSLIIDFRELERSWQRAPRVVPRSARPRSATTKSDCNTISRAHALLPSSPDRLAWANASEQPVLRFTSKTQGQVKRGSQQAQSNVSERNQPGNGLPPRPSESKSRRKTQRSLMIRDNRALDLTSPDAKSSDEHSCVQSSQSNAGLKKRDVIHEVQAAAAVKLQEKLAFLDRERLRTRQHQQQHD